MTFVRISEALAEPGLRDEFRVRLRELVADFPERYDGLLRQEIRVDAADPLRIQYVSWWRDEVALERYAGVGWRHDPVTFPDEDRYLQAPLTLRHLLVS